MGEFFGPYELVRPLASGGMGRVYLARSVGPEGFEKRVVVKTMLPGAKQGDQSVAMFLDEARLAAQLHHPNVCSVFDFGRMADTYYLAMEYVPGVSAAKLLDDCLQGSVELPWPVVCRIILDAASGLHYAHEAADAQGQRLHVVHRDVSPQNLMVSFEGGVKVIDFGIARAVGRATQTLAGTLKGKFAYMSPEQADGLELDRRSDIYSLGIVFHELLTGIRVLDRGSDGATLRAARNGEVALPSHSKPGLPEGLDALVMKMLRLSPDDRFPTARDFALALDAWLLENRAPASGLQLAAFMNQLYPGGEGGLSAPTTITPGSDDGLSRTFPSARITPDPAALAEPGRVTRPMGPPPMPAPPRQQPPTSAAPVPDYELASPAPERLARRSSDRAPDPTPIHRVRRAPALVAAGVLALIGLGTWTASRSSSVPPAGPPERVRLSLTSSAPGAHATLNGVALGTIPIVNLDIPRAPTGRLALVAPGRVAREEEISLESDQRLSWELAPRLVKIPLTSQPPGAQVRAGSALLGTTPLEWSAAPGADPVHLLFSLEGHESISRDLVPAEGAALHVILKKGKQRDLDLWRTR